MPLLQGDTAGLSVADLLQSFEGNLRTGTLALQAGEFSAKVHFRAGKVASFACDGRASLGETLVRTGTITSRQLQNALSRRGRSTKPLTEFLGRGVDEQGVRDAAEAALFEDVCDAITGLTGSFTFADGEPVPGAFDADELALGLALAAGPLLLEAARRADHQMLARETIPSDTVHFVAAAGAEPPADVDDLELARGLLALLDGTRSVREVLAYYPTQRFAAFQMLATLVDGGRARAATTDELARVAESLAAEPRRARAVLARGLAVQPHHPGLQRLEARLAEAVGDAVGATNALKVLAHLASAAGQPDEAHSALLHAKRLAPSDTAVREKLLALALEQGRKDAVVQEGLELATLYREPGLHGKVCDVLQRLVKFVPDAFELHKELATALADAGRSGDAIRGLQQLANALIAKGRELAARDLLTVVLTLDPKHEAAKRTIAAIDAQEFALRRERRGRLLRRLRLGLAVTLLGVGVVLEARARLDLVKTISRIDHDRLVENGDYAGVLTLYREVAARHPIACTTWFDVRWRIDDLEQKAAPQAPSVAPGTQPWPGAPTSRDPSVRTPSPRREAPESRSR